MTPCHSLQLPLAASVVSSRAVDKNSIVHDSLLVFGAPPYCREGSIWQPEGIGRDDKPDIYHNAYNFYSILHHHIATVEKLPLTTNGCPLVIQCRNFRVVHFVIPKERDCHDIYSSLLQLHRPVSYSELYAFSYNPPKQNDLQREEGWQLIDLAAEFERMGVPCDQWQLSDVNRDYKVCDTYPRDIYVPSTVSKPIIVGSSKFRSKGRFPVLSYFFQEKKAAVCRCSQPLSGFSARCLEDEHMLQAISRANPNSRFMYVMDTRPKLNALANRAAGKGYENEDNYLNIRFQFVGIENIHVMRSSLQKLLEVIGSKSLSVTEFLTGIENSGWLRHIKAILDAAITLSKVLIEKDWISFGHKFADRCDQLDGDPKEVSPVFTQFLECVWHLLEQFPMAFEYNEWFLIQIHEHVHSCQFGNFLGNCQREREEMRFWRNMYLQYDRSMHPRQVVLNHISTVRGNSRDLEEKIKVLEAKLHKQGSVWIQNLDEPTKHPVYPVRPSSLILEEPLNCKEHDQKVPTNDSIRTVEGSSSAENVYDEVPSSLMKPEPTMVSLELGVARMTC
ncbi:MTMR6 protein, partial [Polypterus senegalus]